jgi:transposase InsO family protein
MAAESELLGEIWEIYTGSDENYGSPRVTRELRSRGRVVNHKRVERLMHLHELVGITERRRVRTTIPAEDAPPLPDLIERRFAPGEPDVAWAGDITYSAQFTVMCSWSLDLLMSRRFPVRRAVHNQRCSECQETVVRPEPGRPWVRVGQSLECGFFGG